MAAAIAALDVGSVARIPVFDIRNGVATAARNIYVRPTIPEGYKWVPVGGVAPAGAVENMHAYIRSAWGHLSHHPPPNLNDQSRRKVAIVLGVSRAIMTAYFTIGGQDLIPGEVVAPIYALHQAVDANNAPVGAPVLNTVGAVNVEPYQAAQAFAPLTVLEQAAIAVIATCSVGTLPLQGYSLIMTGHHYLSDPKGQSRRAFDVVERQFWKTQSVGTWFSDHLDEIRDAMWHKAGHPVSITIKHTLAKDPRVARMLGDAGVGSAAARLPALESEMRAANSYKTLCSTVRPLLAAYGGGLDFTVLTDAMEVVELFPMQGVALPVPPEYVLPPSVVDRNSALAFLGRVLSANSDIAAFCYGFYCALADNNLMVSSTSVPDTLRLSYSLKKLQSQSYASYIAGSEAFRDYQSAKNALRSAGQYNPPHFTFT